MLFMKPVLHINAGVGWSATKPLCTTFERVGYTTWRPVTEYQMLYCIYERKYVPDHARYYWETHHSHRKEDFVRKYTTLHYYIKYFKNKVEKGYDGVADFSNSNGDLPEHFLKEIAPELQEHFDVRITMIFRNPVRRSYSQISNYYRHQIDQENAPPAWKANDEKRENEWKKLKEEYPDSISYWKQELIENKPHFISNYANLYRKYKNAFAKVFPMVMEEVWEDPSSLSNFIGHDIDEMDLNLYFPERGTNMPEIKGYKHQYQSDMQNLSEEDLNYGREKLDWVYKEFKDEFGYIPPSW